MIIGVNTRFLLKEKMEGFGWFTYETISRIVKKYPEHTFIFFFDRPFDSSFIFAENVTPVVVYPPARHPVLFKIWFDFSLPRQLKKYNCDALISPDGFLSLRTEIPQLSVIHDLNFEHNPGDLPKQAVKYLRHYFPKFAHHAKRICTVSNYSKKDIVETYRVSADKIDVTYNGVSPVFHPIPLSEQESIRVEYTNGRPFVVFIGAIHKRKNLPRLIAAFKRLKEETSLPHALLIVGAPLFSNKDLDFPQSLKDDVFFTGHISLNELAGITATAEILAFVSYFEGFGIPIIEAMKSGTAVLAGNKTSLPEVAGDAAYYCDPYDVNSIFNGMKHLLEHEDERKTLIEKGLERSKSFSWDFTAENLWNSFEKMMHQET